MARATQKCFLCSSSNCTSEKESEFADNKLENHPTRLFLKLASRYLQITSTTGSGNYFEENGVDNRDLQQLRYCNPCGHKIQQFCQLYHQWFELQLKLNEMTKVMADLMESPENLGKAKTAPRPRSEKKLSPNIKRFKTEFLSKVLQLKNNEFPRPVLTDFKKKKFKCEIKQERITIAYEIESRSSSSSLPPASQADEDDDAFTERDGNIGSDSEMELDDPGDSDSVLSLQLASDDETKSSSSYKCRYCPNVYREKDGRKSHEKMHLQCLSTLSTKIHKCRFCAKSFTRKTSCHDHEISHTGQKSFECELCQMRFIRIHQAFVHLDITHGLTKNVSSHVKMFCSECNLTFRSRAALTGHLIKCYQPKQKKCVSNSNNKKQNSNTATAKATTPIQKELTLTVNGETLFRCRYCDKSFIKRNNRKSHEEVKHLGKGKLRQDLDEIQIIEVQVDADAINSHNHDHDIKEEYEDQNQESEEPFETSVVKTERT